MTTSAITQGIHHAGLTVPDLTAAQRFFVETLGFSTVGAIDDYPAVFLSDGSVMITLWQVKDRSRAVPFDRHQNIGLHHMALQVADLEAVHERLTAADDVAIEFDPEPLGQGPTRHLMCTIPGGVRIEFIAPGA